MYREITNFHSECRKWSRYCKNRYCLEKNIFGRFFNLLSEFTLKMFGEEQTNVLFNHVMTEWIEGVHKFQHETDFDSVSEDEWMSRRINDMGTKITHCFLQIESNILLRNDLQNDPDWLEYHNHCYHHAVYQNEYLSFYQDLVHGIKKNITYLRMRIRNCSVDESIHSIFQDKRHAWKMMKIFEEKLKIKKYSGIDKYCSSVDEYLFGMDEGSVLIQRYKQAKLYPHLEIVPF